MSRPRCGDILGLPLTVCWGDYVSTKPITINVPDDIRAAENMDEATFASELPLMAALKLYELGRLSSGRAAELAGIPRVEFVAALDRYRIFPFESELRALSLAQE